MPPICMPTKERPVQVVWGDCLRVMSTLPPGCVDTVITDPPYHLTAGKGARGGFMGKTWDGGDIAFRPEVWAECLRVAKPGAFLLAFGGTRTWHRLAYAIEDAGWELRDTLCWHYGTGYPKSKSCLKPSWEPVILALKPAPRVPPLNIDGARIPTTDVIHMPSDSAMVVGGNGGTGYDRPWKSDSEALTRRRERAAEAIAKANTIGRWPANVVLSHHESCECLGTKQVASNWRANKGQMHGSIYGNGKGLSGPDGSRGHKDIDGMETVEEWTCHQDCPVRLLDEQTGPLRAKGNKGPTKRRESNGVWSAHGSSFGVGPDGPVDPGDSGGPSRFYYCSKASKTERGEGNNHVAVKPLALMRWLVRLVSFPGDLILDPFAGSGTTGLAAVQEGRSCLLVEKEQPSVKIIRSRLASMAPEAISNGADSGR